MSTVVKVLIGVVMCAAFCCAGGVFLGFRAWTGGSSSYQEALAFGRPAFERIGKTWDPLVVDRFASVEMQSTQSPDQRRALYQRFFERLGPLEGTSNWRFLKINWLNTGTFVEMTCDATFKKGIGTARITCVKHGEHWQLAGMGIFSASLK